MEFRLASLLVLRCAGLSEFTDEVVARADVRDAIAKFDYTVYSDEEARTKSYVQLTTLIDIIMKDGRTVSARADEAKDSPVLPMNEQEVAKKFRECAEFASWPADRSIRIIEQALELETLISIRKFAELLRG